jgi:hypothetical protein
MFWMLGRSRALRGEGGRKFGEVSDVEIFYWLGGPENLGV